MTVTQAITTKPAVRLFADHQGRGIIPNRVEGDPPGPIDQLRRESIANPFTEPESNEVRVHPKIGYHHNVPKLQAEGLIEYDRSTEIIRVETNPEQWEVLKHCTSK